MSHHRKTTACALFVAVACFGANALMASIATAAGAADGARDARPPPPPPGVIIEPRRKADDGDSADSDDEDDVTGQRPGCPANTRKLELIA